MSNDGSFATFEVFPISADESRILTDFTKECCKFKEYIAKEFELDDLVAYVVAEIAIHNYSLLIEDNPDLKSIVRRNAEYLKEEIVKEQGKQNPPDEAA